MLDEHTAVSSRTGCQAERLNAARDLLDEPTVTTNADALTAAPHKMEQAQEAADLLYARWAELTDKAGG